MLDNPILADRRVRQALILAVDRQAISDRLFAGKQPVAATGVHPLDWVHTTDGVPTYGYDPARAEALLEEAGWTRGPKGLRVNAGGQPLAFEPMTTAGNRSRALVPQVLADSWNRAGGEARLRTEPARLVFGGSVAP